MFKQILTWGLVAGLIVGGIDFCIFTFGSDHDFDNGMVVGYAVMLLALSAVFMGIKRHRDTDLGGVIRFWPAFGMGLAMSVIAGVMYVAAWEASQAITGGDFIGAYTSYVVEQARARGESAAAIAKLTQDMATLKVQYADPWFRLPMTFTEIFPVGVLVSLVSAALLRRPQFMAVKRVG